MFKVRVSRAVAILMVLVLFDSCGGRSDGVVTLKFWALGNEGENVQKLIPEFEHQNPGIKIVVQQIPWTAAHEKLLTAFAGNSLPDIFQLGNTWIPEFSFLGAIDSLNDEVAQSAGITSSNFFPGIWETNTLGSALYGIPWYVDARLLYYRKDILTKAGFPDGPKSWTDLLTASARIVKSDVKRYSIFLPTNEWQPLVLFALEAGASLLKDNNTHADFTSKEFVKAFSFLRSFYTKGYSPQSWMEIQNIYQGIAEGYITMYITGPWNVGEFKRRLPTDVQDKWMTAPMVSVDGSHPGFSFAGGSSLVIANSSRKKEAAWKLIEFLSKATVQLDFYRLTGDLPTVRRAWDDSTLSADPYMSAFLQQLQYLKSTPKIPEWEQIATQIMNSAEVAVNQHSPDSTILNMLNGQVDQILEKRRWMYEQGKLKL